MDSHAVLRNGLIVLMPLAAAFGIAAAFHTAGYTFNADPVQPPLGEPGSTHEHALFFVLANNTPQNLLRDAFILQSPIVHFHENSGAIIHKEATGVTMHTFFNTVPLTTSNGCVQLENASFCGEVVYWRNGGSASRETFLYTEVQQGDVYVLAVNTSAERVEEFLEKRLPEAYRENPELRGRAA